MARRKRPPSRARRLRASAIRGSGDRDDGLSRQRQIETGPRLHMAGRAVRGKWTGSRGEDEVTKRPSCLRRQETEAPFPSRSSSSSSSSRPLRSRLAASNRFRCTLDPSVLAPLLELRVPESETALLLLLVRQHDVRALPPGLARQLLDVEICNQGDCSDALESNKSSKDRKTPFLSRRSGLNACSAKRKQARTRQKLKDALREVDRSTTLPSRTHTPQAPPPSRPFLKMSAQPPQSRFARWIGHDPTITNAASTTGAPPSAVAPLDVY